MTRLERWRLSKGMALRDRLILQVPMGPVYLFAATCKALAAFTARFIPPEKEDRRDG